MEYLNEGKIIQKVIEFINDPREKQALLIDGEWGSGKTFFIKNILIDKIRETRYEKPIIYTSLYGIESCKEISNQLCMHIIGNKFGQKDGSKVEKSLKVIPKFAPMLIKFLKIEEKIPDISSLSEMIDMISIKDSIIILDDLERCSININEVLGYINNLVEHNNLKIILVANESEIGKLNLYKNIEKKYEIVLSQNLKLKNSSEKNTQLTEEELIEYTKTLFCADPLYNQIKEKLIGTTIKYRPSIDTLFEKIINEYILDNESKSVLIRNKCKIVDIMNKRECYNIRTLIFGFMSFEKLHSIICSKNFNNDYRDEIIDSILEYCLELSIFIKSGNQPHQWSNDVQMGMVKLFDKVNLYDNSVYGYKFVDDYILYNIINEDIILNVISRAMENKKDKLQLEIQSELYINKLAYWWELEDHELLSCLNGLLNDLNDNKYKLIDYKEIIRVLTNLEYNGIHYKQQHENIISQMIKNFQSIDVFDDEYDIERFNEYDISDVREWSEIYLKIITPLNEIVNRRKNINDLNKINGCFNNNNWGEAILEYCIQNRDKLLQDRKFFALIDVDKLVNIIENSNTKNIYKFISALSKLYSFSNLNEYFKADEQNLNKFKTLIPVTETSQTKKLALNRLIEIIDKILIGVSK